MRSQVGPHFTTGFLPPVRLAIYRLFVAPKALQTSTGVDLSAVRWRVLICDFTLALYVFVLTGSLLLMALDVTLSVARNILET